MLKFHTSEMKREKADVSNQTLKLVKTGYFKSFSKALNSFLSKIVLPQITDYSQEINSKLLNIII